MLTDSGTSYCATDPCLPNPCQHNATCTAFKVTQQFLFLENFKHQNQSNVLTSICVLAFLNCPFKLKQIWLKLEVRCQERSMANLRQLPSSNYKLFLSQSKSRLICRKHSNARARTDLRARCALTTSTNAPTHPAKMMLFVLIRWAHLPVSAKTASAVCIFLQNLSFISSTS